MNSEDSQSKPEKTIPVIEERLNVSVQDVEKAKVRVSKQVHEEEVTVDVPFVHEEIDVQRIAKNISIEAIPDVRYEGETMIVPVIKEEIVVQKKLVLVEEIHITKRKVEEHNPQQVRLKKEEIKIDRTNNADQSSI
ncbi:YsnF/AvaK domain-containing protein [Pontibacter sp. H249]|uniref:YsnF/AvaK domain-containing protein n=1 Tax=Pontibacter sp. H249 TaxID=3133420 RepID=UPI0030C4E6B5